MLGITGYRIIGSKGDYIILDKRTGPLLPMPVYPVPSNTYMGIHVTNTTDGNVIIGPNADMVTDFTYYGVPQKNMDYLAESASDLWPCIHKADYIRNYSGILPKWVDEKGVIQDFKIEIKDEIAPHALNLVGIESPGLTAAVPIARYAIELMKERETLEENPDFKPGEKRNPPFRPVHQRRAGRADQREPGLRRSDLPLRKGDKSRDPSGNSQSIRRRYYDRCEIQDPIHDGTVSGGLLPDAY